MLVFLPLDATGLCTSCTSTIFLLQPVEGQWTAVRLHLLHLSSSDPRGIDLTRTFGCGK